ncbi:MAG: M20/M25/M40 family metallo-hydrolase [Candidatus Aenigmarchaeota archaeon]|nr:M20/M25/M40 family metallo-hydrolase [Candidatus Aenigmarchaeota archaeon]
MNRPEIADLFAKETVDGRFRSQLHDLVGIPTISSQPERGDDIRKGAGLVQKYLEDIGAETKLIVTPGSPLVFGKIEGSVGSPTIGFYGHYDVQPAAMEDGWNTDPFSMVEKDEVFYGRGTADQKGPLLSSMEGVRLALKEGLDLNYIFLAEGEEEMGSRNFRDAIDIVAGRFKADAVVVPDVGWLTESMPAVMYGLRGLVYMHWTYRTAERDGHSGHLGGVADNPLDELMRLRQLCSYSETGIFKIHEMYDDIREPTEEELTEWKSLPIDPETYRREHGLRRMTTPRMITSDKLKMLQNVWAYPAMDSHGLAGGYNVRDGKKTVMPAYGQLLVSIRIVPDQDPRKVFKEVKSFIEGKNPHVDVKAAALARPYLGDFRGPHTMAMVDAMEEGFGIRPVRIRGGGTIGAVADMVDVFGNIPIVMPGVEKPSYAIHGPNEHYGKDMARGVIKSVFGYLDRVSRMGK